MSAWIQAGYDGLFDYGVKHTDDYRGYVVCTEVGPDIWFAYSYKRGVGHTWIAEGTKAEAMQALEGYEEMAEQTYMVATYSCTCTAYVRTTLRRALEAHTTHNVWSGTEYVNTAKSLVPNSYVTCKLPDEQTWELTKLELMTINRALEWRKGHREIGRVDSTIHAGTVEEWAQIEEEIYRVLRPIWHSEGKYWM